jgi:hypothetical protein
MNAEPKPGWGSPEHLDALKKIRELTAAGWAGVMPNGNLVDRRENPNAIPVPKNSLLGVPEPKFLD